MKTMIDTEQKKMVRKFKTMLNYYHIDRNAELQMLAAYKVESCKDMTVYELIEACDNMQKTHDSEYSKLDKLRKRVLASACSLNGLRGYPTSIEYAKRTVMKAVPEYSHFNAIPTERLNAIYSAFKHAQKDFKSVKEMVATDIDHSSKLN